MPQLTPESFVRDLPFSAQRRLGKMLDIGDVWENLVCIIPRNPDSLFQIEEVDTNELRYTTQAVYQLRMRPNRTERFLKDWGTQKCRIKHLIKALENVQLFEAAVFLQRDVLKMEPQPLPNPPQDQPQIQPHNPQQDQPQIQPHNPQQDQPQILPLNPQQDQPQIPPLNPPQNPQQLSNRLPNPSLNSPQQLHSNPPSASSYNQPHHNDSPIDRPCHQSPGPAHIPSHISSQSLPCDPVSLEPSHYSPSPSSLPHYASHSNNAAHYVLHNISAAHYASHSNDAVSAMHVPQPLNQITHRDPVESGLGELDIDSPVAVSSECGANYVSASSRSYDGSCAATAGSSGSILSSGMGSSSEQYSEASIAGTSSHRVPTQSEDDSLVAMDHELLRSITGNFNERHLSKGGSLIGTGGFGDVFLGIFRNGMKVAVKRLKNDSEDDRKLFITEIKTLCEYKHEHLVSLMGYCSSGERQCLVYQYMANGSLEDRLACEHETPPLSVAMRVEIARGTASGLQYLHSMGVTHRDIKSANILLDEEYKPKVGDFATAKVAPTGMTTKIMLATSVIGTQAYLAPEAISEFEIHPGLDVYSFGVVLLELITGSNVFDSNRENKDLKLHVEEYCDPEEGGDIFDLRDPKVADGWTRDLIQKLYRVSQMCLLRSRKRRIKIHDVVEKLNNIYVPGM